MKISEPTFIEPSSSQMIAAANEIEAALLNAEVGQWITIELDRAGHRSAVRKILRERGITVKAARGLLHAQAPATARPHVHKFVYPPGVMDARTVDGRCACGEIKPKSVPEDEEAA